MKGAFLHPIPLDRAEWLFEEMGKLGIEYSNMEATRANLMILHASHDVPKNISFMYKPGASYFDVTYGRIRNFGSSYTVANSPEQFVSHVKRLRSTHV